MIRPGAISNAIDNATGVRIREHPITRKDHGRLEGEADEMVKNSGPPSCRRTRPGGFRLRTGWAAHVLIEPLDGPPPCLIGRGSVVTLRRCVIVEAMNSARINMAFVWDVGLL